MNSGSEEVVKPARIGFVSLGCPKALVDSERILTQLKSDGYEFTSNYEDASVVVVNTCGFIDDARAESLESIQYALQENGKVIVTGCLGAKEQEIRNRFPGVLHISGPQQYDSVVQSVREVAPLQKPEDAFVELIPGHGVKLTPSHYAYLKISEGCNHKCSFCIIPSMRGRLRSRNVSEIMREAESLAQAGVRELLIISQDTSAYGSDIAYETGQWNGANYRSDLESLCTALGSLGIWVRLHYVYPYPHVDNIIPLMAEGRILPYLDIPFQHGSPGVLKRMRRPAARENTLERIARWREICPQITIRSTFIVGFPGETDAEFEELLDFLRIAQLDRVGCFQYSAVEGAAANALDNPVSSAEKARRWDVFMRTQRDISESKMEKKVGTSIEVLVDELNDDELVGRSHADAPEIDGVVYLRGETDVRPGDLVMAKVYDTTEYDLYADILST